MEIKTVQEIKEANISQLVSDRFKKAVAEKTIGFNDKSHESLIVSSQDKKVKYHLTKVEDLKEKPPASDAKDPFENPDNVVVDSLAGSHRLILNKFPFTANHFLLTTKEFVSQDSLISPKELEIVDAILNNLGSDHPYFAIYNSGPNSGFSQPHKHIQFMPLPKGYTPFAERLVEQADESEEQELTLEKTNFLSNKKLNFKHFILPLPPKGQEDRDGVLAYEYMKLVTKVLNVFKMTSNEYGSNNKISYNFVMATDWMMIIPRSKSEHTAGDMSLGLNSIAYVGLFLSTDDVTSAYLEQPGNADLALQDCGFDKNLGVVDGQEVKGDEYDF